jgi:hypothetical protein
MVVEAKWEISMTEEEMIAYAGYAGISLNGTNITQPEQLTNDSFTPRSFGILIEDSLQPFTFYPRFNNFGQTYTVTSAQPVKPFALSSAHIYFVEMLFIGVGITLFFWLLVLVFAYETKNRTILQIADELSWKKSPVKKLCCILE